ncbi:MAG: DUF4112 domain-containing protein [Myxococcota bacterium]
MSEAEPSKSLVRVRKLVRWLDDRVKLPILGGVGLDGLLGLIFPVFGDALTGMGSIALLITARRERVPAGTLLRMVFNIVVDVVLGAIPVVGDLFDVAWRSNRRNLALLERHRGEGSGGLADGLIVGVGLLLAVAAVLMPIWVLVWAGGTLYDWVSQF